MKSVLTSRSLTAHSKTKQCFYASPSKTDASNGHVPVVPTITRRQAVAVAKCTPGVLPNDILVRGAAFPSRYIPNFGDIVYYIYIEFPEDDKRKPNDLHWSFHGVVENSRLRLHEHALPAFITHPLVVEKLMYRIRFRDQAA